MEVTTSRIINTSQVDSKSKSVVSEFHSPSDWPQSNILKSYLSLSESGIIIQSDDCLRNSSLTRLQRFMRHKLWLILYERNLYPAVTFNDWRVSKRRKSVKIKFRLPLKLFAALGLKRSESEHETYSGSNLLKSF